MQAVPCAVWTAATKAIKFAVSHMADLQKLVQIADLAGSHVACGQGVAASDSSPGSSHSDFCSSEQASEDVDQGVSQQWLEAQQAMCRTASSVHSLLSVMAVTKISASCLTGVPPAVVMHRLQRRTCRGHNSVSFFFILQC